jgi:hypothetical protein
VIPAGQVLRLAATFTIDSPTGAVTGTKTLSAVVPADATHAGLCRDFSSTPSPFGSITGSYKELRAYDLSYTATIKTLDGAFKDEGTAQAQGRQGHIASSTFLSDVNDFTEIFQSTLTTPTPVADRPGKGCGDKNHVHERQRECSREL